MTRENINALRNLIRGIISHPWLKLISFVLAVMVWFYVRGLMDSYY